MFQYYNTVPIPFVSRHGPGIIGIGGFIVGILRLYIATFGAGSMIHLATQVPCSELKRILGVNKLGFE